MIDFQRMMLWFALALVLVMLYERWIAYTTPPEAPTTTEAQQSVDGVSNEPADAGVPGAPEVLESTGNNQTSADQTMPSVEDQVAPAAQQDDGGLVSVETDTLNVKISTTGADLVAVDLVQHALSAEERDLPFSIIKKIPTDTGPDIFVTQSGLIGKKDGFPKDLPNHTTTYVSESDDYELGANQESLEVPFLFESGDGVTYRKVYVFKRGSYGIDVRFEIANSTDQEFNAHLYAQFQRTNVTDAGGFSLMRAAPSYLGGAIYTEEEKYEKVKFGDIDEAKMQRRVDGGWVAMLQHYFVGAILPRSDESNFFYTGKLDKGDTARYQIGLKSAEPTTIAAGGSGTLSTRLYVGPKERNQLLKEESEGLELTVDYGFLTPISEPLFWLLSKIHGVVGNWGWAIIFLTMLVKLVFFPLSAASYKSMAKMKKLQPRLATLKERYGDDRQKLNQEMMQLYKKEKINPLGGCLPILVQIPVFIALYWVLLESVELRQAPFMLWIQDLSIRDPYFVLPIAMGASMVAQQFLNPAPVDPIQQKVMMALPIVFTFIFLWFPAGLVLYWLVNNVLSISQQWYITRKLVKS